MVTCPGRSSPGRRALVPAEHFGPSPASRHVRRPRGAAGPAPASNLQRITGFSVDASTRQPHVLSSSKTTASRLDGSIRQPLVPRLLTVSRPADGGVGTSNTTAYAVQCAALGQSHDAPSRPVVSFDERTEITPHRAVRLHGSRHRFVSTTRDRRVPPSLANDHPPSCPGSSAVPHIPAWTDGRRRNDGPPSPAPGLSPGTTGRRPGRPGPAPAWAEWARCRGA